VRASRYSAAASLNLAHAVVFVKLTGQVTVRLERQTMRRPISKTRLIPPGPADRCPVVATRNGPEARGFDAGMAGLSLRAEGTKGRSDAPTMSPRPGETLFTARRRQVDRRGAGGPCCRS
jgi:hypothetical protein